MKKLPLLLLAAAFGSLPVSAQFRLSGHIGGMPDSLRLAVVNVENPDNTRLICTTYPTDGAFTLMSDSLTQPTVCELRLPAPCTEDGALHHALFGPLCGFCPSHAVGAYDDEGT